MPIFDFPKDLKVVAEVEVFTLGLYILFAVTAFVCEYVDSALGGGYGTLLVPFLMILFDIPKALLIPAVLFSEIFAGFGSALLHHKLGNATFSIRKKNKQASVQKIAYKMSQPEDSHDQITRTQRYVNNQFSRKREILHSIHLSEDAQLSFTLGFLGIIGGIVAAFASFNIPDKAVKTYIGVLVIIVGLIVLARLKWKFSWWKISAIGLLAAFNKGLSGGGYGPLISSGQIIVDRNPKQAIASTSLSEALVCVASLVIYMSSGTIIFSAGYWYMFVSLFIGAMLSVPLAVLTVKYLSVNKLQPSIGVIAILLGIFMLLKAYIPSFS